MRHLLAPLLVLLLCHGAFAESDGKTPIHAVVDLSHSFTFYFDGRWTRQYLTPIGGKGASSFCSLSKCSFENTNLLVLQSDGTPCRYPASDIAKVREFLARGGGVVVLGDYGVFRKETEYHLNDLARAFGATFLDEGIRKPVKAVLEPTLTEALVCHGGKTIQLRDEDPDGKPTQWRVLVRDAQQKVAAALRPVGKGRLMLVSRGLSGSRPDATDPINDTWWHQILPELVVGLPVDSKKGVRGEVEDIHVKHDKLDLKHTEYLASYAKQMIDVYDECYPHIEAVMGVPPSPGQLSTLRLLATGGGGFSSGDTIGLAVWWGNFPEERYGMIQLIGHEATHSWVLPFAEPLWNEGIATYVGDRINERMGHAEEAKRQYERAIKLVKSQLAKGSGTDVGNRQAQAEAPHGVVMGMPVYVFEELRKDTPDILARYFQLKRKLITRGKFSVFTRDDSAALLGQAAGKNLFEWFNSLGITVSREKVNPLLR
jgi:hypothetical protein